MSSMYLPAGLSFWRASRTASAGFVSDALEQAIHQRRRAQFAACRRCQGSVAALTREAFRLRLPSVNVNPTDKYQLGWVAMP